MYKISPNDFRKALSYPEFKPFYHFPSWQNFVEEMQAERL